MSAGPHLTRIGKNGRCTAAATNEWQGQEDQGQILERDENGEGMTDIVNSARPVDPSLLIRSILQGWTIPCECLLNLPTSEMGDGLGFSPHSVSASTKCTRHIAVCGALAVRMSGLKIWADRPSI
jgi:hypothetical protein